MTRESMKNDVPDEWKKRARAGLCPVCAKSPPEFEKGQRIYCSQKCREEYANMYTSWSDFRYKILEQRGLVCQQCGINEKNNMEEIEKQQRERLREWIKNNPSILNKMRADRLTYLDERFRKDFDEIMDDEILAERELGWEGKKEIYKGLKNEYEGLRFDLDHIIPVAAGGNMWDENNIQVLCETCHKKKTKEDIKDIVITRKQNKHGTLKAVL